MYGRAIATVEGSYTRDDLSLRERLVQVGKVERVGRSVHPTGCWGVAGGGPQRPEGDQMQPRVHAYQRARRIISRLEVY